jgi:hypothetical protein
MGADVIHFSAHARRLARKRLPWMVFDYTDGAAGGEAGLDRLWQVLSEETSLAMAQIGLCDLGPEALGSIRDASAERHPASPAVPILEHM